MQPDRNASLNTAILHFWCSSGVQFCAFRPAFVAKNRRRCTHFGHFCVYFATTDVFGHPNAFSAQFPYNLRRSTYVLAQIYHTFCTFYDDLGWFYTHFRSKQILVYACASGFYALTKVETINKKHYFRKFIKRFTPNYTTNLSRWYTAFCVV